MQVFFQSLGKGESSYLTNSQQITANNVVLSAWLKCCTGCDPKKVPACNNPDATSYYVVTLSNCNGTVVCQTAPICPSSGGATNCFVYPPGTVNQYRPSTNIDQSFCYLLSTISAAGSPIVGFADTGSCGGGDPGVFMTNISTYVGPKLYFVGVMFALITVIQSTVLFVGCFVLFCVSRPPSDEED